MSCLLLYAVFSTHSDADQTRSSFLFFIYVIEESPCSGTASSWKPRPVTSHIVLYDWSARGYRKRFEHSGRNRNLTGVSTFTKSTLFPAEILEARQVKELTDLSPPQPTGKNINMEQKSVSDDNNNDDEMT